MAVCFSCNLSTFLGFSSAFAAVISSATVAKFSSMLARSSSFSELVRRPEFV